MSAPVEFEPEFADDGFCGGLFSMVWISFEQAKVGIRFDLSKATLYLLASTQKLQALPKPKISILNRIFRISINIIFGHKRSSVGKDVIIHYHLKD